MDSLTELIKNEVEFCDRIGLELNESGQYIYISKNGRSMLNLPFILLDYKDYLIDNKIIPTNNQ